MRTVNKELQANQDQISLLDFLGSFNKNMPAGYPLATAGLLKEFKESHEVLFKNGDSWSLDLHRKRFMDWLPRNIESRN
ncbi:MAG TPA: hypothetical protein VJJ24_00235 [Candidatus Paceibacterota bacterium]